MKFKEFIKEETVSGNIGSYDVPYASGKGYYRTDVPTHKRNKKNCPKDKNGNFLVNVED